MGNVYLKRNKITIFSGKIDFVYNVCVSTIAFARSLPL